MAKDLLHDEQVRAAVGVGIDKLADAVRVTLGPRGRNVAFDQKYDVPLVTNDGVTIAKSITLENAFENMGAALLRDAAQKTNFVAGDGTTASIVLAQAILKEGIKNVVAGANPVLLKEGIEKATQAAVAKLSEIKVPVEGKQMYYQVAKISGNNDDFIGEIVSDAFDKVGTRGIVTVEDSQLPDTKLKYAKGIRIENGYISEKFINNENNKTVELANPYILVYDGTIKNFKEILPLLEEVHESGSTLLIIASDVTDEALTTLLVNVVNKTLKVAAVKAPGYGGTRQRNLKALSYTTGASVVDEQSGIKLSEHGLDICGRAERVIIDKETTIIQNPQFADNEEVEMMYRQVKKTIAETKEDYEIEKLQVTIALLTGGMAVITVGGISELEMFERKYRIEDAVNAVYAAIEDGIVPGGGCALLSCADAVDEVVNSLSGDQRTGAVIVRKALEAPIRQIAQNAGEEGSVVIREIRNKNEKNFGFNALTMTYGDMFEMGIIDPTKVVKTSLINAASVAEMMLTTNAAVADPKHNEEPKQYQ